MWNCYLVCRHRMDYFPSIAAYGIIFSNLHLPEIFNGVMPLPGDLALSFRFCSRWKSWYIRSNFGSSITLAATSQPTDLIRYGQLHLAQSKRFGLTCCHSLNTSWPM